MNAGVDPAAPDFFLPLPTFVRLLPMLLILLGTLALLGWAVAKSFRSSAGGGWGALSNAYPAPEGLEPEGGETFRGESTKIGWVVYKRVATFTVTEKGIWLKIGKRRAFIPWEAISRIGSTTLYWNRIPRLTVGDPPIASFSVPPEVFRVARDRFPAELLKRLEGAG